jgi:hypothetical protein
LGKWTWLSGSDVLVAKRSVIGIKGLTSASNHPSGRTYHAMTAISSQNAFYIYGGRGYANGYLGIHVNAMIYV